MVLDPAANPQLATPLLDALRVEVQYPTVSFYTPGHKRGRGTSDRIAELFGRQIFQSDLPDLPGLSLFAPDGAIAKAQNLAAEAFGADRTWFLVNGSTCGVMAAIVATCAPGDKIILPRNIHQSAIAGLIVSGAHPVFVVPEYDPVVDLTHNVAPETIAEALEQHADAKAVMIVSPTYQGICGDIAAIARQVHNYGIPLLVDEAHGAHFAFHPALPTAALAAGADLAVQSTHKTLSAMTQASMLHLKGSRIDPGRVSQALQLLQSSSPSNLLLASLDAARQQMATQGKALLERTIRLADEARSRIGQIPGLSVLQPKPTKTPGFYALDPTRLTVTVSALGIDGFAADEIFYEQLGVTAELPTLQHLTFIITLGNTAEDSDRLVDAFKHLSDKYRSEGTGKIEGQSLPKFPPSPNSMPVLSPRAAFFSPTETIPISQAIGRISAETICPYPPGIPILLPGEAITEDAIASLQRIVGAGGFVSGCADASLQTLRVISK
ncbi:arginine/lysine/ornithine decarboxylase [Pleurocapsa sp. PCC 7327]|uniref:aminotransferase class I/II-fold pyridoxal phosphate-dependent enzyme n=1 Tax=Pleurocapsa sp. PCC 7327 TaxID=118163 RepID=UPI00029FE1AE|nr:aminotransferase class I/II-fold pyridoxal phosphate-dependent enzyme [Pleurocapsa sp. PCC 7327]AFY75540.1 arginine/lysine/ornithine decarboxylase [Pleurocapsa sp. PCC 7327]